MHHLLALTMSLIVFTVHWGLTLLPEFRVRIVPSRWCIPGHLGKHSREGLVGDHLGRLQPKQAPVVKVPRIRQRAQVPLASHTSFCELVLKRVGHGVLHESKGHGSARCHCWVGLSHSCSDIGTWVLRCVQRCQKGRALCDRKICCCCCSLLFLFFLL